MHCARPLLLLGTALALSLPARAEEAHPAAAPGHDSHSTSPWELRVGVETPLFDHVSIAGESETRGIWNTFEPQVEVLVGYMLIPHTLTLELELAEGWLLAGKEADLPKRVGTVLRPGVSFNLLHDPLPLYGVFMLPMHLEPDYFLLGVRLGVGTTFHLPIPHARLFVELDLDFPLAGGDGTPSAFSQQSLALAAGLLFHL